MPLGVPELTNEVIDRLRTASPDLASEYFAFLARNGGAESELAIDPGWIHVWEADYALTGSSEYGLADFLPGYFAFGSNGAGELFVIQRGAENPPVFMVPAGDLNAGSLAQVADNFAVLEAAMRTDA